MRQVIKLWPLWISAMLCGGLGYALGLPMPFMLGGLFGAAGAVLVIEARQETGGDLRLPPWFRKVFHAAIGAMIGATFSPELLGLMPAFWPSLLAVIAFIVVAHLGGYAIMRRIGGYPKVDALYASMPGGLVEASILGEQAGADPRILSIQHFIRLILVVVTVPLLFWLVTGQVVGSAGGQTLSLAAWGLADLGLIAMIGAGGLVLGRIIRLPAGHLMGPMVLSAVLHGAGVLSVESPPWLLHLAQLVVGLSLGAQFSGLTGKMLRHGLAVGLWAVGYMLVLSLAFALVLRGVVPEDTAVLFLAYAPGGVTEMSLIALSLQASPVVVAAHHLLRIAFTVFIAQGLGRRLI